MLAFEFSGAGGAAGPARNLHSPSLRLRRPVAGRSSEQILHTLLDSGARLTRRRDDQDGVVTSDRAGDFLEFFRVEGRGKRLRARGGSLEYQQVERGTQVNEKLPQGTPERRHGRGSFVAIGKRLVASYGLDELQLGHVPRERRLRHAHLHVRELAA